jgi:hypothetical protein
MASSRLLAGERAALEQLSYGAIAGRRLEANDR